MKLLAIMSLCLVAGCAQADGPTGPHGAKSGKATSAGKPELRTGRLPSHVQGRWKNRDGSHGAQKTNIREGAKPPAPRK